MRTIIRNDYTPELGDYHERIVIDETKGKQWLFDCDGVFTDITGGDIEIANEFGDKTGAAISQKFFTDTVETLNDDINSVLGNLETETTAREQADTRIETAVSGLTDALATETTNRINADTNLQSQIDAITVSSDVKDIVGTYAQLQAYDTSTLGNNDIIKVLQDESQNDETTYYRWSTATSTFTLIGEEGPYYTKSQTDTLLNAKQDTLTAGANIQISNNTISATDTTYSDFTGTDGTTAGAAGLVPAPAITDADKYLKSDGTWGTVQAGPTVVQTTGTSTTDVMSQDATTSMVFENPSKTRIRIGSGASIGNINSLGAVVIGQDATSASSSSAEFGPTVIGPYAYGYGYRSSVIGYKVRGEGAYTVAIGGGWTNTECTKALATSAIAVGYNAQSTAHSAVSLGANARASGNGSIALGRNSAATLNGEMNIGSDNSSYGYNNSNYRLLTGLYDGQSDHDAVTVGQLNTAIAGVGAAEINATDWSALWQ